MSGNSRSPIFPNGNALNSGSRTAGRVFLGEKCIVSMTKTLWLIQLILFHWQFKTCNTDSKIGPDLLMREGDEKGVEGGMRLGDDGGE